MKYLLFPLVALGFATAAMAQPPSPAKSYPPCSKTVTDECVGSSHAAAKAPVHHGKMAHHHRHVTHATAKPVKAKAKAS
jgi:hypothetical protein